MKINKLAIHIISVFLATLCVPFIANGSHVPEKLSGKICWFNDQNYDDKVNGEPVFALMLDEARPGFVGIYLNKENSDKEPREIINVTYGSSAPLLLETIKSLVFNGTIATPRHKKKTISEKYRTWTVQNLGTKGVIRDSELWRIDSYQMLRQRAPILLDCIDIEAFKVQLFAEKGPMIDFLLAHRSSQITGTPGKPLERSAFELVKSVAKQYYEAKRTQAEAFVEHLECLEPAESAKRVKRETKEPQTTEK